MWEKLEQIARRCAEIGELLTVPEIYGDAKELRRLTQEQKELEPVAQCYEDYRRAERTIAEATELLAKSARASPMSLRSASFKLPVEPAAAIAPDEYRR